MSSNSRGPMAIDRVVNGVSSFTPVKIHLNYPSVVKPQGHAYICLYLATTITSAYNRAGTCTDAYRCCCCLLTCIQVSCIAECQSNIVQSLHGMQCGSHLL